jgi:hypothetical protein
MSCRSHFAPDFDLAPSGPFKAIASSYGSAATRLAAILDALAEGLTAHRRYEYFKASGIPHGTALKMTFGIRIRQIE